MQDIEADDAILGVLRIILRAQCSADSRKEEMFSVRYMWSKTGRYGEDLELGDNFRRVK